jgi:hypothetical protein
MLTILRLLAHSVEKEESWFFRISTSARKLAIASNYSCLFWFLRSDISLNPRTFRASSYLFNFFWSSRARFFSSRISLLLLMRSSTSPTSSPVLRMSSSRRAMVLVTSCHFSNNLCLSSCSFLNSYAVLSSSICEAWVDVISFYNSCCLRPT